jgi:putative aminopeptidase FrvX
MQHFKQELYELLTIQAPSGQEHKVRKYLEPKLAKLVDRMFVDKDGNLLAEKKCGTGEGVTVLLSAHMDTVKNIQKGRRVIEKDGAFYSTKGVLGADDRAGIAIIMAVLRNIDKIGFDGTLKIAFTVSEEVGCVGSSGMDVNWYKDAALAIVVDRRGNRDIVTGCGTPYNFCSEAVGKFFEDCSALLGMDWKAVGGGISDAMTFSYNGVHSVNLSAGYRNEHTEKEYVVIQDCKDTIYLILQALALVNQFADTFGEVPKGYSRKTYYSSNWDWDDYYYGYDRGANTGASYDEVTIYQQRGSQYGDVTLSDIYGYISIYQEGTSKYSKQEVWMERADFEDMVSAYLKHIGLPTLVQLKKAKLDLIKKEATKSANKNKQADKKQGGKSYIEDKNGQLVEMK